ncbi:MAG: DUF3153 domain-containing protein [cyanobacterium endosymbiont of Rhopalodia musculus]|uniref:DUF3153 domain-containing protein n=1 Tax=cyanobacterium endosymbiont of Epithemia clementina EcSB TaxID=3034674 RepID=UPI00248056EA|nr:DUF3153 domain-containing protein [cyanobacterium endosymbiont of Epithemia clementina EcSB]WGT67268.1 DUF3153 domain-containing protein [cyanobacterium endosymbiont of Epithemia clementina EcSB]
MKNQEQDFNQKSAKQAFRGLLRFFLTPLVISLLTLLSGCVHYDVSVDFFQQHRGEIVQHISLAEQLTNLSQTEVNKWLDSLEKRAENLRGKAKRISPREIIVKIPFGNGKELTEKFNKFFNTPTSRLTQSLKDNDSDLVDLKAKMSLKQGNWLFLEQNLLNLEVDLRALGVLSSQGNVILSTGSLVDLEFALKAPFGLKNIVSNTSFEKKTDQIVWELKPGQINTIEASFWVPSYLGIGTLGIILLMLIGFYAKYRHFPGIQPVK